MMATAPATPGTLQVALNYYPGHEQLLAQGAYQAIGTPARVAAYQMDSAIPLQDFLNYFLIHRALGPEYGSYAARMANIDQSIVWLRNAISLDNGTINSLQSAAGTQERVGEAVSLSIANRLFGLTEADWDIIPIWRGRGAQPTFDFERTWTGINAAGDVVQIEAKGTFVPDSTVSNHQNLRKHAQNIEKKKAKIAANGASYRYPATVRYGMITAVDANRTAQCWILDPEGNQISQNPLDLKMAFRTEYAASMIELIAPNATLIEALRKRADLWRRGDPRRDSGPIVSARGYAYSRRNYVEDFLSEGKVWLPSRDIVGKVFKGDSGPQFFIGMRGDVVRAAISQEVTEMLRSGFAPESSVADAFNQLPGDAGTGRGGRFTLHTTTSGGVIGLVGEPRI